MEERNNASPFYPQNNRYCGHCGARLQPGNRVCGYCGTPVPGASTHARSVEGLTSTLESFLQNKVLVKKVCSALAILLVIVCVIALVGGSKDNMVGTWYSEDGNFAFSLAKDGTFRSSVGVGTGTWFVSDHKLVFVDPLGTKSRYEIISISGRKMQLEFGQNIVTLKKK